MKKLMTLFLLVAITVVMTACSSTVGVYYQKRGPITYYDFVIELSAEDKAAIEESAIQADMGYTTLDRYFADFCSRFPSSLTYGGSTKESLSADASTTYVITMMKTATANSDSSEPDPNYKVTQEKGFWLHRIEVTQTNPLSEYLDSYNSPEEKTLFYYLKNGITDIPDVRDVPAITTAFPAIAQSANGLRLEFNMKKPIFFDGADGERQGNYVKWSCEVGQEITPTVTYSYYVPNSLNWMITLAVVSVLFALVLWLVLRKRKDTSALVDARPLDEKKLELTLRKLKDTATTTPEMMNNQQDGQSIDPFDDKPL